jgi:hypothetical protein
MSGFASQSFRLGAVAAALLLLIQQGQAANSQSQLQQIADEAALAAVQILGANGGPADAVEAAKQTVAAVPGVAAEVTASVTGFVVTVKLSPIDSKAKTAAITSTAHYLPPDQPATWSWASRQRFAVKPSPVVVGSTCMRDCGVNALR